MAAAVATALEARPELRRLRLQRDGLEVQRRLVRNQAQPGLNLNVFASQDVGYAKPSYRQFEQMRPLYVKRHQVRPGITGLAQVCGGYHTDARDKLRFDLIYVSQRSLWLDLWVLLKTVLVVLRSRGS